MPYGQCLQVRLHLKINETLNGSHRRTCYSQGVTADTEIKVASVENQDLTNVFPLKPEIGQNIATHASPTARNVFSPEILFLLFNCVSFGYRSFPCGPTE